MKKDSKKSHDAPLRLFVCPFHTALTAGWKDREGNLHDGQPIWHGMEVRMGRDDEEYINKSTFEEIFNWIYQASIYEWEGMLYCFNYAAKARIHWGEYDEALKDAKELYSFLK